MTKEELESKFEDCFDANTRASEGGYGADTTDKLGMWRAFEQVILEYAKQQAIAFVKWAIEEEKIIGDDRNQAHMPLQEEDVYDQFIEQQNKTLAVPFKEGDYVHYTPTVGPKENGRIKSIQGNTAFVVYKCNNEWSEYKSYTGCGTDISQLSPGWVNSDHPKS